MQSLYQPINTRNNESWQFEVRLNSNHQRRLLFQAVIGEPERMQRLLSIYRRDWKGERQLNDKSFMVECPVNDDRLGVILNELSSEGWEPVFDLSFVDKTQKKFLVRRKREIDPVEEAEAEFLIGFPSVNGGWVQNVMPPDLAVARCDSAEAQKKAEVIALPGNWPMTSGWSDVAISNLHEAGIKGAVFNPIQWEQSPKRRIWHPSWLAALESFPPTLTPRVGNGGIIGSNDEWCGMRLEHGGFDEAAYVDYRLSYRRSDITHLLDVDVACTWEQDQWGELRMPTHMIFSQRFRQWSIEFGCKFTWRPVRLL